MKIAILSRFGHMECAGFLLEAFKEDNVTVYLDYHTDGYNWMTYYKKIYNNIEIIFNDFNSEIINKYDKIFKITSNDECLTHENIVSILHLNELKDKSKNFLSLSPYIFGENITYTFPVFQAEISTNKQKHVTLIGYFENKHADEDLNLFIEKNQEYTFNFIIWNDFDGNNFKKHNNVKVFKNLNTEQLTNIINSSKYILSKKHISYINFSGQLGLAMSFEVPLIVDSKTASSYGLPGVLFDTCYDEIEKLESISDEKYNKIIEDVKVFKEKNIEQNTKNIRDFI